MSDLFQDISSMRKPYQNEDNVFLEKNLITRDPFQLFKIWFEEAKKCKNILEPNAVCLSTCSKSGAPSSRMVLLKYYGTDGFSFFTNGDSRKSQELKENPKAAFLFYWDSLNRQIRIEGDVQELEQHEVTKYFQSRPKISQISATISKQSFPIESRDKLIERFNQVESNYKQSEALPKPQSWTGFKLIPKSFEFWQGQNSRIHDRLLFKKKDDNDNQIDDIFKQEAKNGWFFYRLQP